MREIFSLHPRTLKPYVGGGVTCTRPSHLDNACCCNQEGRINCQEKLSEASWRKWPLNFSGKEGGHGDLEVMEGA